MKFEDLTPDRLKLEHLIRRPHFFQMLIGLALCCLVAATVWPLPLNLGQAVPQGVESAPTVAVLNLWTVGWNASRVQHGWSSYWDSPHFFPTPQSFALSEPIVTTQLVAPLVWLTGTPVVAYNLFLLGNLWLAGWITWHTLLARGCRWPVALLGACIVIRLPFVHRQLGVLQMVPLAGIIATIHFTWHALESGQRKHFYGAGCSLGLTYLTCAYYGLFLALLLPACVCVCCGNQIAQRLTHLNRPLVSQVPSKRTLLFGTPGFLWSALVAAILIGPMAVAQRQALRDPAYERPLELIRDLSALPSDYLETPFPEVLRFMGMARQPDPTRWSFSPGLWKYALAVCGLCLGLRSRSRRSWTLFVTTLAVGAFVGSLGLNLHLAGWSPYQTLVDWVPGLAKVRAPGRFAVIVQLGVVLLSVESLHYLQRWGTIRWRRSKLRRMSTLARPGLTCHSRVYSRCLNWPLAAVWLAGLVACFEVSLPTTRLVKIPPVETQQGWIDWLTRNTPREAVVAHLPFPVGKSARDYEPEAWDMYWGLFHQRRMVNGYSGFFPPGYLKLKEQVQRFPDPESLTALRASGVSYCVIPRAFTESHGLANDKAPQQLERVFCDDLAGTVIFRLHE